MFNAKPTLPRNEEVARVLQEYMEENDAIIECVGLASKMVEKAAYWSAANSAQSRAVPLMLLSQELEKELNLLLAESPSPR